MYAWDRLSHVLASEEALEDYLKKVEEEENGNVFDDVLRTGNDKSTDVDLPSMDVGVCKSAGGTVHKV